MRMRRTLAYLVFASCVLLIAVKNRAADARTGDWTMSKSEAAGKVEFSLIEHHRGGTSSHESDWPASSFQGVDFSKAGRQDVHFTIARDAGKIECEGFLNNGEGAGVFHFQPDASYPRETQALGFSVDDEKQFILVFMMVPDKFALELHGFDVAVIHLADDARVAVIRKTAEFFLQIDRVHVVTYKS